MLKVDPTVQSLTVAGIIAIAISVLINGTLSSHSQDKPTAQMAAETGVSAKGSWARRRPAGLSRRMVKSGSCRRHRGKSSR